MSAIVFSLLDQLLGDQEIAMTKLIPFADDAASVSIAKLTIENGIDRIALYGSLDPTQDRQGLAQARALRAILG